MSQILPSQDELLAHAAAEPAFAAWLQGHGPLQHSAETRAAVFRVTELGALVIKAAKEVTLAYGDRKSVV